MYGFYLALNNYEDESRSVKRKFWVRPIFQLNRRLAQGASDNLVIEMHGDREKYLEYLRMTKQDFNKLLSKVRPFITKQCAVRVPIPPHTRLHICLRYLASGDSMRSLAFSFRVAPNTISKIIPETCRAIWKALKHSSFPKLTSPLWYDHAEQFRTRWNFNHCIGAVDGKQVIMQAPSNSGSTYFNYKNTFGMNLMAIADAHYRFIVVDIGAPGRRSDGGVFKESKMGKRFQNKTFNVPPPDVLCENGPKVPYVLVGDEAFALSDYLMRPYPRSGELDRKKKVFNYRLSRARRVVESAFGILAARWRIFRSPLKTSTKVTTVIIQATTVLHNWLITESLKKSNIHHTQLYSHLTPAERSIPAEGMQDIEWRHEENLQDDLNPLNAREAFADFFMDIGAITCQWEKTLNNEF